jgi:hypothetical protein
VWENSGNGPAKSSHGFLNFAGGLSAPAAQRFTHSDLTPKMNWPFFPIGPKAETGIVFIELSESQLRLAQAHLTYIWGWLAYLDDAATDWHQTRFCWTIEGLSGDPGDRKGDLRISYSLCNEGNCTDDECKAMGYHLPADDKSRDTPPAQ